MRDDTNARAVAETLARLAVLRGLEPWQRTPERMRATLFELVGKLGLAATVLDDGSIAVIADALRRLAEEGGLGA